MSQHKTKQFKPLTVSVLSALSNWLGDIILYPIDAISTRLKGSKHISHDVIPFIKNTIRTDKLKLYRGFFLTFPHSFIPTLIYVYIYENLMQIMSKKVSQYTSKKQIKLLFPFFISSVAEYVCLIAVLPVETVRTRIQMSHPDYQYKSLFEGINDIRRKQGFMRLYKASRVYFGCKVLYTSIQMQCYQTIRYYTSPTVYYTILNTILSTTVATTLLNPLEVLLTRYALVDTTKKKLVFSHMVKRIYKREGVAGFYKGYPVEMFVHCMYSLFWLPCYQFCRSYYGIQISD